MSLGMDTDGISEESSVEIAAEFLRKNLHVKITKVAKSHRVERTKLRRRIRGLKPANSEGIR